MEIPKSSSPCRMCAMEAELCRYQVQLQMTGTWLKSSLRLRGQSLSPWQHPQMAGSKFTVIVECLVHMQHRMHTGTIGGKGLIMHFLPLSTTRRNRQEMKACEEQLQRRRYELSRLQTQLEEAE